MARRLEGRVFHTHKNFGVRAIAEAGVAYDLNCLYGDVGIIRCLPAFDRSETNRQVLIRALSHLGRPVFTFVDPERLVHQRWFSGSTPTQEALIDHIEKEGGIVRKEPFYVPFSNGIEMGHEGSEAELNELRFVTTSREFHETFGIHYGEVYRPRKLTAAHTTES